MRRLVCACVVHKHLKTGFLASRPKYLYIVLNFGLSTSQKCNIYILFDFRRLLAAEQIDVSYFAAGIIAHLASDDSHTWSVAGTDRNDALTHLVGCISLLELNPSSALKKMHLKMSSAEVVCCM